MAAADIDPSLLDKSNEEKQVDASDLPRQFCFASHTSVTRTNIREIRPHGHNNLACWIINLLLDVLLSSMAENFYSLFVYGFVKIRHSS